MTIRQAISVGSLLLDVDNYRHGKLSSQKAALDAIIADQGKKLVKLAEDIIDVGLNPIDPLLVIDAEDGNGNFIVIEGNRRLCAVKIMLESSLAEGTPIHSTFKRLNKQHADAIPKVFECVIVSSRASGLNWINRKHARGLNGAGTEQWESIARARAEVDQGTPHPELDVVNFVLTNPDIEPELRYALNGSSFNITTLERLVTTKETQEALGLSIYDGKLESIENKRWLKAVLTDLVEIISKGRYGEEKFTEREIDSHDKRASFIASVVNRHPKQNKPSKPWLVTEKPKPQKQPRPNRPTPQPTPEPTTDGRLNLIPRKFKIQLPSGKINDVFDELKKLDVKKYRHAVSVLFRVFMELTLSDYIKKHDINLPTDNDNRPIDSFKMRLNRVVTHVRTIGLMTKDELKPINVAISNKNSLLAPDTLHAYVHGAWLDPDPIQLKVAWNNAELFIDRLWNSQK